MATRPFEAAREVSESSRALWHREDLEKLFGLEERAARQLMTLMRRTATGSIHVVERESLLDFLAGAIDAEDLSAHLANCASRHLRSRGAS